MVNMFLLESERLFASPAGQPSLFQILPHRHPLTRRRGGGARCVWASSRQVTPNHLHLFPNNFKLQASFSPKLVRALLREI